MSGATMDGMVALARTWDTFGASHRLRNRSNAGVKREWKASRSTGALGWESRGERNRISASSALEVEGFSSRTCLPFFRALSVHSKCRPLGSGL